MNKSEKVQYLEALIAEKEDVLRKKTDRILEGGDAFDLVLSNQRYFAVQQDKYASKAKEQREKIAFSSVNEMNELVQNRKTL